MKSKQPTTPQLDHSEVTAAIEFNFRGERTITVTRGLSTEEIDDAIGLALTDFVELHPETGGTALLHVGLEAFVVCESGLMESIEVTDTVEPTLDGNLADCVRAMFDRVRPRFLQNLKRLEIDID